MVLIRPLVAGILAKPPIRLLLRLLLSGILLIRCVVQNQSQKSTAVEKERSGERSEAPLGTVSCRIPGAKEIKNISVPSLTLSTAVLRSSLSERLFLIPKCNHP